jgi:radical SAM superfamily enzyme YgiQ (UPF0313 family)
MNIDLIAPVMDAGGGSRGRQITPLGLGVLAALTPEEHTVRIYDENMADYQYQEDVDLVGLSVMTARATRAYEIADEYRRRGVPVVFGGSHPTLVPDESMAHADAIVVGEAELTWPQLLEDLQKGQLQKVYKSPRWVDMDEVPIPRRDLLSAKATFGATSIQATRGCPFDCNFCTVTKFFGGSYRYRSIDLVIKELEQEIERGKRTFFFVDDNIIANRRYARQLFERLIPYKIKWGGQASITAAKDPEVLKLAAESGCMALFIGVESISKETLHNAHKDFNRPENYAENFQKYHDNGIIILAGIIFGFDTDDEGVFEQTVDFLIKHKIGLANFGILTPLPGTEVYTTLNAENRIFERNWSKYSASQVVFYPKKMSPERLKEGHIWAKKEFYSLSSLARRYWANRHHPFFFLGMNYYFHLNADRGYKQLARHIEQTKAAAEADMRRRQTMTDEEIVIQTLVDNCNPG